MDTTLVCIDIYTVREGDTLYSIAQMYDLPVSLLMKINCIIDPYNLQIGTRLCIPGTAEQLPERPQPAPQPPQRPEPSAQNSSAQNTQTQQVQQVQQDPPCPCTPAPQPPRPPMRRHTVAAGDTLYLIAKRYAVRLDDLINANPDLDPYNLLIGTELIIPA